MVLLKITGFNYTIFLLTSKTFFQLLEIDCPQEYNAHVSNIPRGAK